MPLEISSNFKTFSKDLQRSFSRFEACIQSAMDDAMALGVETGRDIIENSGTDRQWSREWYGRDHSGRGRVDTGNMRDEFKAEVDNRRQGVEGKLGWVKEQEDYFFFQDEGFTHRLTGEYIEGMMALLGASEEAWDLLRQKCSECNSDFIRGI